MAVVNNIRKIREEKHLNQEDLAAVTGATRESIGRYERGDRCPSLEMALRICAYFQVGFEDLFRLDPETRQILAANEQEEKRS